MMKSLRSNKIVLLISLIIASQNHLVTAQSSKTQLCFFGPDSRGHYLQRVVPISLARSCEGCLCAPLKETCLFGPDSLGNFATSEVDLEFAETCPRQTCTCSSHDNYTEVARERLAKAARVYAVKIGADFSHGIDPSLIIDGDAQ